MAALPLARSQIPPATQAKNKMTEAIALVCLLLGVAQEEVRFYEK